MGSAPGQFHWPRGIAATESRVYVVDSENARIQVFGLDGAYLASWGSFGTGQGQLNHPWGIDVRGGAVYVADNNRVQIFDGEGTYLGERPFVLGSAPWDVAVDSANNLYVVLHEGHAVVKLGPGGNLITSWGGQGSFAGQFTFPRGIAVDSADNVYVSDSGNSRIQKFDSSGAFLAEWAADDMSDGITIDRLDNLYFCSFDGHVVEKRDTAGVEITRWPSPQDHEFFPIDVAATGGGHLYVVDTNNQRIVHYVDHQVRDIFADGFETGDADRWAPSDDP